MLFTVEIPSSTWQHTLPRVSFLRVCSWNQPKGPLEPAIGELRYIARLNADLLPNEEPFGVVSNIAGGTAIEGSDVVSVSQVSLK